MYEDPSNDPSSSSRSDRPAPKLSQSPCPEWDHGDQSQQSPRMSPESLDYHSDIHEIDVVVKEEEDLTWSVSCTGESPVHHAVSEDGSSSSGVPEHFQVNHQAEMSHRGRPCGKESAETHAEEQKSFNCSLCGKRFARDQDMTLHLQTHSVLTMPDSVDRHLYCPVCRQEWHTVEALQRHLRVHSGEKPFSCSECGKSFAHRGNLTAHQRVHTGERPYSCHLCGRGFTQKGNMKAHEQKHTGKKHHPCSVCGKSFSLKASLKVHQRAHRGEGPSRRPGGEGHQRRAKSSTNRKDAVEVQPRETRSRRAKRMETDHPEDVSQTLQLTRAEEEEEREEEEEEREEEEIGGLINSDGEEVDWNPPDQGDSPDRSSDSSGSPRTTHRSKAAGVKSSPKPTQPPGGSGGRTPGMRGPQAGKRDVPRGRKRRAPVVPENLVEKRKEKISYRCSECGKEFPHAYKLERHERTHTGEKPFHCSLCGKSFNQKGNLKTHQKVHKEENPNLSFDDGESPLIGLFDVPKKKQENPTQETSHSCPECGKDCQNPSALETHMRTHTEETYFLCNDCGMQFTDKEKLEAHQLMHKNEKPYPCPDCGKRFLNESYVKVHQRIHTGERPYRCSQCEKSFYTTSALRNHEIKHTGEKPYVCVVCGKRFCLPSYLTYHYKTHTGKRPHLCSVCGKSYARAEELKVHHRLHTGEKPYQCDECGKKFYYRQGLRQHLKSHAEKPIGPTRQLGRPKQLPRMDN